MANRGTIMNIVSWMLLAIVVCTLIARFAMKLSMKTRKRKLGLDDLFIGLAAVSEGLLKTARIKLSTKSELALQLPTNSSSLDRVYASLGTACAWSYC
jgi:hypothetical protein